MSFWNIRFRRRRSGSRRNVSKRAGRAGRSQFARSRTPVRARRPFWRWTRRVVWLAVLGVGAWGTLLAYHEVAPLAAEWFEIRHVSVTGASQVDRDEIIERMKLRSGETLLSLDADRVANRLKSHVWIKDATVSRVPLHSVAVRVTERQPVAILKTSSLNLLLDEEGHVLSVLKQVDDLELPMILGINPRRVMHGEAQSRQAVQAGIEVASLMEQVFPGRPEVNAGNPSNVIASLRGLRFQFGAPPFEKKWNLYRRIRPALRGTAAPGAAALGTEIDLRYPSKVIVRERG